MSSGSANWWQVVLAVVAAFFTALCAHYFFERRRRRSLIVSTAAKLIASVRQLRRNYLGFAEYDTDFIRQSMSYYQAAKVEASPTVTFPGQLERHEQADLSKAAANAAKSQAQSYQGEILKTQNELDGAYFLLMGVSKRVRNDTKLRDALVELLDFNLVITGDDFKATKRKIQDTFAPNIDIAQQHLGALMEENTQNWFAAHFRRRLNR